MSTPERWEICIVRRRSEQIVSEAEEEVLATRIAYDLRDALRKEGWSVHPRSWMEPMISMSRMRWGVLPQKLAIIWRRKTL